MRKIEAMYHYFGHGEGKCGDCSNLCTYKASHTWHKCKIYGESNSEATDWAKKWQACGMKNKDPTGITPIVKLTRFKDREEVQVEGQINLFDVMGGR